MRYPSSRRGVARWMTSGESLVKKRDDKTNRIREKKKVKCKTRSLSPIALDKSARTRGEERT